MFYLAKIDHRGKYIRTPEIKAKCSETRLKNSIIVSRTMENYWSSLTEEEKKIRLKNWIPKKGRKAWNKGLRSKVYYEAELARNTIEYTNFRKSCFERDLYSCCLSGQKGGDLVVHHINSFSDYPEIRFLIDNGITMSKEIHNKFHSVYGKKHNNLDQLLSFIGG